MELNSSHRVCSAGGIKTYMNNTPTIFAKIQKVHQEKNQWKETLLMLEMI